MNSDDRKVLLRDYDSVIEKNNKYPDSKSTTSIEDSDVIVNPKWSSMMGKEVVISNVGDFPIHKLIKNKNRVISRFKISDSIDKDPYEVPKERRKCKKKDYCIKILTKEAMSDMNLIEDVHNNNYLVGISDIVDGDLTSVGMKLLSTELVSD